jgi:predicted TIM-barrel fold metal-dependent hydrolase
MSTGHLPVVAELAAAYPDTQLVVDHLGLPQAFEPASLATPFADLPSLLDLASYPNIAVKVTGSVTLSNQPFPYDDLWEPLGRVFEAFTFDRCMWGTDWTRATAVATYDDAVRAFRDTDHLSVGDKSALMGASLQRIFGWAPRTP